MAKPFNPFSAIRDLQERVQFLLNVDRQVAEVVEVLRDTHRILEHFGGVVDRLDDSMREAQTKFADFNVARIERLEEAVMNIERATVTIEAHMDALPKRWLRRVERTKAEVEEKEPDEDR